MKIALVNYKTMVLFVKIWNLFEQALSNSRRPKNRIGFLFVSASCSFFGFCFVFVPFVFLPPLFRGVCAWLACPTALSLTLPPFLTYSLSIKREAWAPSPFFWALLVGLSCPPLLTHIHTYTVRWRERPSCVSYFPWFYQWISNYWLLFSLCGLLVLILVTWLPIWVGLMIDKVSLMSSVSKKK